VSGPFSFWPGPIGRPIDPALPDAQRAQNAFDHVKQKIGPEESGLTSWTQESKIARDKFAGGDPRSVTKVSMEDLRQLEQQGKIKIYTPEDVETLLLNSGNKKLAKQASAIRQQMERNREILIAGEIPPGIQSPLK
jgi:hypothetical protein